MSDAEKVLILVSPDKLGRYFLSMAPEGNRFVYAYDKSSNLKRIFKLVQKKVLSFSGILQMAWADQRRPTLEIRVQPTEAVASNIDLRELIEKYQIKKVYLFRAGLIISRRTLNEKIRFLNIHCARIPDYGGIGVIARALRDRAYSQEATLHEVVESIDSGEVVAIEPYVLEEKKSYRLNEDVAYQAGARLLVRELSKEL